MNLLMGIVVGILLTIGTAFMAYAFVTSDVTAENCSKQIVIGMSLKSAFTKRPRRLR